MYNNTKCSHNVAKKLYANLTVMKISCNEVCIFFVNKEGWPHKFLLKRGGLIEDWYDLAKEI